MDKQTLFNYVSEERARGVHDEDIKAELISKGWAEMMISEVMNTVGFSTQNTLPSLYELLKRSFDELWRNIWKSFLIMVLPIVLVGGIGLVGGLSMVFVHSENSLFGFGGLIFVAVVLMCVVMFISTIMLIKEIASDWTLSYGNALTESVAYIFPLLWVAVLTTLAILGGFSAFIVPGFIATIWYAFAQIATIIDHKRGMRALLYSKELVKGNFANVFIYYAVALVIVTLANLILGIIPLIGSFISLLTTPFMLIFSVHFYNALKKVTVVTEFRPVTHRLTTVLIVLGLAASAFTVWLAVHFSSL